MDKKPEAGAPEKKPIESTVYPEVDKAKGISKRKTEAVV